MSHRAHQRLAYLAGDKPRLRVASGDQNDRCPSCGILRMNAGFLRETCGAGYLTPGCFVEAVAPDGQTEEQKDG